MLDLDYYFRLLLQVARKRFFQYYIIYNKSMTYQILVLKSFQLNEVSDFILVRVVMYVS